MRQASFGLIAVAAMATAAQAEIHSFDINMDGSQEAPNPGDPDGSAVGTLTIDDVTNEIAWSFVYENLDTLVAMHIHIAPKGASGPVVVGMGIATSGGPGTLIDSTTTTGANVAAILADPTAYYVNLHTSAFPGGAVRDQLPAASVPVEVELSELRIDQTDVDNDEYVELAGTPGGSLDGLTYIVLGDGQGGSGVIEYVLDLSGQVINESGFFVVAEATFSLGTADLVVDDLNFENSDNVTHMLVSGFTGALNDDLDADDDCVLDVTPWESIVDSIALVESNPPKGSECFYGPFVGPDGMFVPGHAYRCQPENAWTIGPFDPAAGVDTPGAVNGDCATPCVGDLNGDLAVDGADLGELLSQWGSTGSGDLSGDGTVDGADLGLLLAAWGACP